MISRRRALQIFAATAAVPTAARAIEKRFVLGAEVSITLDGPASLTGPAQTAAWDEIERLEGQFSLYQPSALTELNKNGVLSSPSPDFLNILSLSKRIFDATQGRFDPTVQPLWAAKWNGIESTEIDNTVGFDRVVFQTGTVKLDHGQELTLNGIAQGYITDRVIAALQEHGLTRSLVNIGEFRALSGPWQLGIADPDFGLLAQVSLTDNAVATSSPSMMTLADGSTHIIDPTNRQNTPEWSTVSVIAPSAALADGLSTAFCHMSPEEIQSAMATITEPLAIRLIDATGNLRSL